LLTTRAVGATVGAAVFVFGTLAGPGIAASSDSIVAGKLRPTEVRLAADRSTPTAASLHSLEIVEAGCSNLVQRLPAAVAEFPNFSRNVSPSHSRPCFPGLMARLPMIIISDRDANLPRE
jgi:hypothetical protein